MALDIFRVVVQFFLAGLLNYFFFCFFNFGMDNDPDFYFSVFIFKTFLAFSYMTLALTSSVSGKDS